MNNIFGKCVDGRFSPSREIKENIEKSVLNMAYVNNVKLDGILHQFVAIESLGVQCEPKCRGCKCGTCRISGKPFSLREEIELKIIEDKLEFRGSYWITGYPWLKDPKMLPDNYEYALKRLKITEWRLKRDETLMNMYIKQINDMVDRGVARNLPLSEISGYNGPIHYIANHGVAKPDSLTTPLRIVFDSSHM